MPNFNIHETSILVNLTITSWTGRKYDKKVTDKLNKDHGATSDAGRYNKMLLPGDAASYAALTKHQSATRVKHYEQTLNWIKDGERLLPLANRTKYHDMIAASRNKAVNLQGTHGGFCIEHYQPPCVWFTPQTGIINLELRESPSNFKRYRVSWTRITELETAVETASIGSDGFCYVNPQKFFQRLDELEKEMESFSTVIRDKAYETAITQAS